MVEVLTIDELKKGSGRVGILPIGEPRTEKDPVLETHLMNEKEKFARVSMPKENEFSLLKKIAEDRSQGHALCFIGYGRAAKPKSKQY